ncbi:FtsX-like permease family protein [Nocardioides sp.]|uniref:FtsX-like permease family protein n=1 Tax=Nocardioides sp. TaxID=35761 RepID=UPI002637FDE9|nr:FtsX-like permease family protein [Nocardioides sp.]MDI6908560.1 hypothetical protein [Nocardioides sp.]
MRTRYRPFQALALAALAALVAACAVFAPLYDRAMQQALTDITVERADPAVAGLQLIATRAGGGGFGFQNRERPAAPETIAEVVPAGTRAHYLAPVLGYAAEANVLPGSSRDPGGDVVWREGACEHLTLVAGVCAERAGEIMVSAADADNFDLPVGTRLAIPGIPHNGAHATVPRAHLVVAGVYDQEPSAYWLGLQLTGRSGLVDPGPPAQVQHDVWLTARSTFEGPGLPPLPAGRSTVGLPLDVDALGVDDLFALSDAIRRLAKTAGAGADGTIVTPYSGLPDLADDVREQSDQSQVTVPLLMAQLGLLALVVLWLTLLAVTEQRRPEVALARLRGRGRRGARGLLLGELLPVALAGVLPGAALALLGVWAARTMLLPGHAPFETGVRLLGALGLAVLALVLLTGLAVARVAREPVETLLRRVPPRRNSWALGTGDALVVAGCGSLVVVFATGGLEGPVALAAPGLLAVVVGLVLAHLTGPITALAGRRALARGRVRAAVSLLDAARSPATRRVVAIVTLASALAVFSADAFVVGDRNRASAAAQETGARLIADVEGGDLAAVRGALADVDPDGRRVTPVVRIRPPGTGAVETVAVVPDQFRRIALLGTAAPPASAWDRLAVSDAEPIRISGTRLRVDVDDSTLVSIRTDGERGPLSLGLDLVTPAGETLHTAVADLPDEVAHARFEVTSYCRDGCFVTAVWLQTVPGATLTGTATLSNLVGEEPVAIGPASRWTPLQDPVVGDMVPDSTTPDRLTIRVRSEGSSELTMRQAWLPSVVPALVAGALPPASQGDDFDLTGLDGTVRAAARVGTLTRVPGAGPDVAVANLDLVQRGVSLATSARVALWFAADDRDLLAEVDAALHDRGAGIATTTTLADVRRGYDESAAAWSVQLAAIVGAAAVLIALLVLLVGAASSWRFRTRDLAALRMSGVPRRTVGAMAVAAQLPAVAVGVVAGTAAGLYGAYLALPTVPLLADPPAVSTLDLDTAWSAVAVAVLAVLAVLATASVLIGRTLARRSDVRRLRETL